MACKQLAQILFDKKRNHNAPNAFLLEAHLPRQRRQLIFDGVRLLQDRLDLERLIYVGFGSIWFTDFMLAHKILRIDDMVSIEGDDTWLCNEHAAPLKREIL